MIKVLHFSDAHIDIASQGRRDPVSGLPYRVMDFLKALDAIVAAAIEEKVDLVLFAGDAYKDRNPQPTYQREWNRRILTLTKAKIPIMMIVGNHDISPALGKAHTLQEYGSLEVPFVKVVDKPQLFKPDDLWDLPLQVIGIPWVTRSAVMAAMQNSTDSAEESQDQIEELLTQLIHKLLDSVDPTLPVVLAAHASVQGATYGNERSVMLGTDMILPGSIVFDHRIAYTALGHIHKAQDVHQGKQPPVVYPGSIERVDFNEAKDEKYYVIAKVETGKTEFEFRCLDGRKFIDNYLRIDGKSSRDNFMDEIMKKIPASAVLKDAIMRLAIEYPREWEPLLDEHAIREMTADTFEFHLVRKPIMENRVRLPNNKAWTDLTPMELLDAFVIRNKINDDEAGLMKKYAGDLFNQKSGDGEDLV